MPLHWRGTPWWKVQYVVVLPCTGTAAAAVSALLTRQDKGLRLSIAALHHAHAAVRTACCRGWV
jgi:hypothetical protein